MSEPYTAWPDRPRGSVDLPSVVRMSQQQLDQLFERLAFWLRQTHSQDGQDQYQQWTEKLFVGLGATEVQVAQSDGSRGLLLFSAQGTGAASLRVTPQIGSNDGMVIQGGSVPQIFTRRWHGPLASTSWWAVGAGVVNLYVLGMRR